MKHRIRLTDNEGQHRDIRIEVSFDRSNLQLFVEDKRANDPMVELNAETGQLLVTYRNPYTGAVEDDDLVCNLHGTHIRIRED